jgi:hypothetical protein
MRKTLSSLLALCAILVCLPASAQTITSLSLSKPVGPSDSLRGGETTTLTINLSGNAASNMTANLFSTIPQIQVPSTVTISAGTNSAAVRITPLPVDTAVSGFVGVSLPGSPTLFTRLTVLNGPPYHFRLALSTRPRGTGSFGPMTGLRPW